MKREDITNLFPEATAEQVNTLMGIHGNDINNAKKGFEELRKSLEEAQGQLEQNGNNAEELAKAIERANGLQTELDAMKAADAIRATREKVSKETGVPAHLLTKESEEELAEQAKAILAFAQPSPPTGYPQIRDHGEIVNTSGGKTRDQFKEWFESNLQK